MSFFDLLSLGFLKDSYNQNLSLAIVSVVIPCWCSCKVFGVGGWCFVVLSLCRNPLVDWAMGSSSKYPPHLLPPPPLQMGQEGLRGPDLDISLSLLGQALVKIVCLDSCPSLRRTTYSGIFQNGYFFLFCFLKQTGLLCCLL